VTTDAKNQEPDAIASDTPDSPLCSPPPLSEPPLTEVELNEVVVRRLRELGYL